MSVDPFQFKSSKITRLVWLVAGLVCAFATPLQAAATASTQASARPFNRGMWVWNAPQILATQGAATALLKGARASKITDLYLYLGAADYTGHQAALASFNKSAHAAGVRVWGLDGARIYFADAQGPAGFASSVTSLVTFNQNVAANQRFVGFQADNEPNDSGGYTTFHDGIIDADLATASGTGDWQASQAADREMLMRSWLSMHQAASEQLHAAGLLFGAVMPAWTMDYYGEPVQVAYPLATSPRQGVTEHMMALVDEFVVMTYNTNTDNALNRVLAQVQYASQLPATQRPKVYASVEVTQDVGVTISYGDTPGKNSRKVVLQDVATINQALAGYPAYAGMAIEAWEGWQALQP